MTKLLKIMTAAVVLFAAAASLRANGLHLTIVPGNQFALIETNAPQLSADVAPTTQLGDGDPRFAPTRPFSRSWYLLPFSIYSLPVLILTVILLFKHRRLRMMHDTLRVMIDKGVPITPELVASLRPPSDMRGHLMCFLLPGLILSGVGIGLIVNAGRSGLIPLLIGFAFLVAWQVEKRSANSNRPPRQ